MYLAKELKFSVDTRRYSEIDFFLKCPFDMKRISVPGHQKNLLLSQLMLLHGSHQA